MVTTHPTDYGPEPSVSQLQAEVFRLEGEIKRLRAELDGCKATEKDLGGIIRAQEDEIELLRSGTVRHQGDEGQAMSNLRP